MAYVNVAEWTSQHVGDWLYGLDDSILPYVQFFVNNQINGCRLLLLTAQDLVNLNIHKIGHQEIILEAVELLRNLHYNITSETLQTISLRLACKARALYNQLKKHAERVQQAQRLLATPSNDSVHNGDHPHGHGVDHHHHHHHHYGGKNHKKDKDKDKSGHQHQTQQHHNLLHIASNHHHHQQQQQQHLANNSTPETFVDLSPVSTQTLSSVSDILAAVKDFISWIDRYPFDGNEKYLEARKSILQSSIELTSTAQRDQFVQGPNEVIKKSCKKMADLCDRLVQELNDSLAIQAASLEVVTVTKNMDEDLGMHIHSSYSGIHVVGGVKFHSPAHLNGNIEEGDEIVQVNYQTVVGWQLKKLVASMRRFPTKLILTVKKRPRHHTAGSFTVVPQFALPLPEIAIIGNSSLPLGLLSTQFGSMTTNGDSATNQGNGFNVGTVDGCYNNVLAPPPQQQQSPSAMVQDFRTIPPTSSSSSSSSSSFNKNLTANNGDKSQTQQTKTDPSTSSYDTIGVRNTNNQNDGQTIGYGDLDATNRRKPLMHDTNVQQQQNVQYSQPPEAASPRVKKKSTTASVVPPRLAVANNSKTTTTTTKLTVAAHGDGKTPQQNKKRQSKNPHHHHHHHRQPQHHLHNPRPHHSHHSNRMATARCSSASDSSPLSDLSDSSTVFTTTATNTTTTTTTTTTDTDDDSDSPITMIATDFVDGTKNKNPKQPESESSNKPKAAQQSQQQQTPTKNKSKKKKKQQKQQQQQNLQPTMVVNDNGDCTDEFEAEEEEEEEEEINDNDSAFYSGRHTNTSSSTISKHSDSMKIGHGASSLSSSSSCSSSKNTTTTNNDNNNNNSTNNTIKSSLVQMRMTKSAKADLNFGGNDSGDSGIRESRDDGEEPLSDYNGGQQMETSAKPRTSAEFEELYLKKKNHHHHHHHHHTHGLASSIQTLGAGNNYDDGGGKSNRPTVTARASTLPPNTQPCNVMVTGNGDDLVVAEPDNRTNRSAMIVRKPLTNVAAATQPQFTSIQLSTITHLTSLAKNIRFANMAQLPNNNCNNNPPPNLNPNIQSNLVHTTNPHSKSKFDPILAQKLEQTINKLSDGDLVMGNHEDHLYTYKGSDRIGGNSADIPSLGYITDRRKLKKWTRLRSVLKDNCLYSYLNEQTAIACFEIPIHLPGYYILVDKQMFLDGDDHNMANDGHDDNDGDDGDEPKQLVVFKLVTYHRLFMFAVDSLRKLIRWIIRFGYRFCCNPTEPQLCFTYYLSPAHIGDTSSRSLKGHSQRSSNDLVTDNSRKSSTSTISTRMTTNVNDDNTNVDERSKSNNEQIQFSESDDYHDLLTVDPSGDLHVKFSSSLNDGSRANSHDDNDDGNVDGDDDGMVANRKDAHRFIKSPHPRGSVRFAVKPLRNQAGRKDLDFIDSMIDPKTALAKLDLIEGTNSARQPDSANGRPFSEIKMMPAGRTETIDANIDQLSSTAAPVGRPPELPPRSSSSAAGNSSSVMVNQNINQAAMVGDNFTVDVTLPRPKPRISKMAITDSGTNGGAGGGGGSPSKASNSIITSAAVQRLAPIPVVPEKSAAISQTIQHFANLQRQNNLRRSFAQQQQQNSLNNSNNKMFNMSNQQSHPYSDYDYITQRPILNQSSITGSRDETKPLEVDEEMAPIVSPMMSTIGNPLYCHVPLLKQPQPQTKPMQDDGLDDDNDDDLDSKSKPQSNMDREYNRLFGDRKPSEVLMMATIGKQQSGADLESGESYQSSSSDETGRSSMPPSIKPPPPPPPPQSLPLSSCTEDGDLGAGGGGGGDSGLFTSNPLSSPKVQAKRKKHVVPIMAASSQSSGPPLVAPPKPQRSDSNSSRKSLDKGISPTTQGPPTLLPRRAQGTKLVPPPLPKTSHPLLARSNSQQSSSNAINNNNNNNNNNNVTVDSSTSMVTNQQHNSSVHCAPPPVCPKPDILKFSTTNDGGGGGVGVGVGKYLNRSFSDAAYGRAINPSNGSTIPSEPPGNMDDEQQPQQSQQQSNVGVGCSSSFGSASSLGTASNNETSPSNRSLPTMGVSMLAKKRLSNVSADCSAIEKALHNHRQQQQQQ